MTSLCAAGFAVRCWLRCALAASLCAAGFAMRCWQSATFYREFPGKSRNIFFRDSPGIIFLVGFFSENFFAGIFRDKMFPGFCREKFPGFSRENFFSRAGPARAGPGRPEPGRDGTARAIRDISLTNLGIAPFQKCTHGDLKMFWGGDPSKSLS